MIINSAPIGFTPEDYIKASLYLGVPVKELKKVIIHSCSIHDYRFMVNSTNSSQRRDAKYVIKINDTLFSGYHSEETNLTYYLGKSAILCLGYAVNNGIVAQVRDHLDRLSESGSRIGSYNSRIQESYRSMSAQYASMGILKMFDTKRFEHACRKYKIACDLSDGELIKLTIRNPKCGNDIEGYVNYRAIELHLQKSDFGTMAAKFYFSNYYVDTTWGLASAFHPHISASGAICFGNRAADWRLYCAAQEYEFILELLKETVNAYSSENPYINVVRLGGIIRGLSKNAKELFTDGKLTTIDSRSMLNNAARCQSCGSYMDEEGECTNNSCRCNRHAIINCNSCGTEMLIIGERRNDGMYERECQNSNCIESPKFTAYAIASKPFCRICGKIMRGTFTCSCNMNRQWESRYHPRYDCDVYIAIKLSGEPDICPDITEIAGIENLPENRRRTVVNSLLLQRNNADFASTSITITHPQIELLPVDHSGEIFIENGRVKFRCQKCGSVLSPDREGDDYNYSCICEESAGYCQFYISESGTAENTYERWNFDDDNETWETITAPFNLSDYIVLDDEEEDDE